MLGMPFGAGTAHIVQLGPVGVEQGLVQVANDIGELGGQARRSPSQHRAHSQDRPLFHGAPSSPVHAAACDALIFKDDRYRTDVAAAGKVYRRYRGRPSRAANSLAFEGPRYRRYKRRTSAIHRRYKLPVTSHEESLMLKVTSGTTARRSRRKLSRPKPSGRKSPKEDKIARKRTGMAGRHAAELERYRLALESMNLNTYDWDIANNVVYISPAMRETVGFGPDQPFSLKNWGDF